jgi:hypothetical protein
LIETLCIEKDVSMMPRWVKISLVVAALLAAAFVALHLAGLGHIGHGG